VNGSGAVEFRGAPSAAAGNRAAAGGGLACALARDEATHRCPAAAAAGPPFVLAAGARLDVAGGGADGGGGLLFLRCASLTPRSRLVFTSFTPRLRLIYASFHLVDASFAPRLHLLHTSFAPPPHLVSPRSLLACTAFAPRSRQMRRAAHLHLLLHLICTSFTPHLHPIRAPVARARCVGPPVGAAWLRDILNGSVPGLAVAGAAACFGPVAAAEAERLEFLLPANGTSAAPAPAVAVGPVPYRPGEVVAVRARLADGLNQTVCSSTTLLSYIAAAQVGIRRKSGVNVV
jgi:hypothetical protein